MDSDALRAAVAARRPELRAALERLVAVPSIAFDGFPAEPVAEAAALTAELLEAAGVQDVETVPVGGGDGPVVLGHVPGPPGAPTVLLYAHYDVQPAPPEEWTSPPFAPTERGGRLYGRGAADDKSGIVMHLAALGAWEGRPPVSVKVVVEGGEETGRMRLDADVVAHPERYAADVLVIADSGNWVVGEPVLTTTLRGMVAVEVEVQALAQAVHNGLMGGPAPDALLALVRMLASLHDDRGAVAVEGIAGEPWAGYAVDEASFRHHAGVLDGVGLIGDGAIADHLWSRPSINVIGIDAPPVAGAANILVPRARAVVGLRIPPAAEPAQATAALVSHLEAAAPWNVRATVRAAEPAPPSALPVDGPAVAAAERALAAAYGRPAQRMGSGGAIPLVSTLRAALPDAEVIIWGAEDTGEARIHGPDESVDLEELERMALAEAILLGELAAG